MTRVQRVNRFFLLLAAPVMGLLLCLMLFPPQIDLHLDTDSYKSPLTLSSSSGKLLQDLDAAEKSARSTTTSIKKTLNLYNQTTKTMSTIVQKASVQAQRPESIYDTRIRSKLGRPIETVDSDKIRLELFRVNAVTYKGYAMKVKLKDPSAMRMSLAGEQLGSSETTLHAAQRYGAIAGINAGGFADQNGKRYPLSTTMMDGQYLTGFQSSFKDLYFVGLNDSGKLIGGKFDRQDELDSLQPAFGASFVPILLENGRKTAIPAKWKAAPKRAPRTIIGSYKDDQLIIFVIDGYNETGGSGATLEEIQSQLYKIGVVNAYNLDGGGSSSLVMNGRVVNHPSDGNLRPVPTSFLFFR
ncbi:phosphodiester glycosidase family protein [Saccharibacillus sp. CPCC 101409]|uniref:phosphodiester glycosidase family protein n=1 Tax=Saccharibacillus sp. CPCC 101409 TaxID=3058041 RepID=UPI0026718479|nr:phosphodiester glycosidase family protein [Saccharibacillus sp. CPCC 101409]MDO3408811.1 phosphodiester glycosidase family protein [Saccharibacillus sp. CPCC 101409]